MPRRWPEERWLSSNAPNWPVLRTKRPEAEHQAAVPPPRLPVRLPFWLRLTPYRSAPLVPLVPVPSMSRVGDNRFRPSFACRFERVPRLQDSICHGEAESRVVALTNHQPQTLVHLPDCLILGFHGFDSENLQHQCGGQISCAIDGKQNL